MIFASGFSRWMRRMEARASWSAAAVTVQVFRTTKSASKAELAGLRPWAANWRSKAAPSAWVARQPKLCTKNPGTKSIIRVFPFYDFGQELTTYIAAACISLARSSDFQKSHGVHMKRRILLVDDELAI